MKENSRDSPEVRLGDAREFYAHALRTGDERAQEQAEQALSDAKEAIAREHRLPAEAREELEQDIAQLRARLTERPEPGDALVRESSEGQPDDAPDILTLAEASLAAAEVAHAPATVARVGRQAIEEQARVQLEGLGEQFAEEMAAIEQSLAVARSAGVASARRREELEREQREAEDEARLAGAGRLLAPLAVVASLGQIGLAQEAFDVAAPLTAGASLLLAISYVAGLAFVAVLTGGLLASARGPYAAMRRTIAAVAAVLLCGPPIVLATVAFGPLSGGDLMLAVVGLLFIALCLAIGYQVRDRELARRYRVESVWEDFHRAEEQLASLSAQRFAVMEVYVARGMTAYAEGSRMSSLLTLQILQLAPQLDVQDLGYEHDHPLPGWLQNVRRELHRNRYRFGSEAPGAPSGMSEEAASVARD